MQRAAAAGALRVGLTMMVVGNDGMLSVPAPRLAGAATGQGDEQLNIGPLKIFMDGGKQLGIRLRPLEVLTSLITALSRSLKTRSAEAYRLATEVSLRPHADGYLRGGMLFYEVESARKLCLDAQQRGFSVACHAIGNEAISRALHALPATPQHRPAGVGPNRIEHFLTTEPWHAGRAAEKEIAVAAQPAFLDRIGEIVLSIGFPRPARFLPLREMIDAGVCVAGSSDAPVDDFAPLRAMARAIDRTTSTGQCLAPEQGISPTETLQMYTSEAAKAGGITATCGSLEVGKRADLVWLSDDPTRAGVLTADHVRVRGTWVGGQRVYG